MKAIKLLSALMFFSFNLMSCEVNDLVQNDLSEEAIITELTDSPMEVVEFSTNPDSVQTDDTSGLYLMREEEKLARDVYSYFYEKFNYRIFSNISKSENRHSDAVLRLINYFGLTDPAVAEVAVFTNPDIQALYNKLTTDATTVEQALATGAFIEEYDIADLKKLLIETENADIKLVYSNLLRGSESHIKAFTRILKLRGVVYVPQILSVEEYNSILAE